MDKMAWSQPVAALDFNSESEKTRICSSISSYDIFALAGSTHVNTVLEAFGMVTDTASKAKRKQRG